MSVTNIPSNSTLNSSVSSSNSTQSNGELKSTLDNFANNEQIASGASFLGKVVSGTDANNNQVSGVADQVFMQNGTLMIGIGSSAISVANVTGVSLLPQ